MQRKRARADVAGDDGVGDDDGQDLSSMRQERVTALVRLKGTGFLFKKC